MGALLVENLHLAGYEVSLATDGVEAKRMFAAQGADLCILVDDAETRLARDAQNQADGQRWWLHLGNVLLNFGVGAFLAFGYHHWGAGAWNAVGGTLIGEAIILTQPTSTIDDLRVYRSGALDAGHF